MCDVCGNEEIFLCVRGGENEWLLCDVYSSENEWLSKFLVVHHSSYIGISTKKRQESVEFDWFRHLAVN